MNTKQTTFIGLGLPLGLLCLALALVALVPSLKNSLRESLISPSRQVLSTVSGFLQENGLRLKVLKIKTEEGLFLEIYGQSQQEGRRLLHKIKMLDERDGYFHLNRKATNLALNDIDQDGVVEILASSYDDRLVAHLNVYKYDQNSQKFHLVTGP